MEPLHRRNKTKQNRIVRLCTNNLCEEEYDGQQKKDLHLANLTDYISQGGRFTEKKKEYIINVLREHDKRMLAVFSVGCTDTPGVRASYWYRKSFHFFLPFSREA